MGDDAITSLEITNVEKQGLPRKIMVSVCSEKETLAWSPGPEWCGGENSDSIQDKLKHRRERSTFVIFQWPFDRELLLGPERFWWVAYSHLAVIPTPIPFTNWKIKTFAIGHPSLDSNEAKWGDSLRLQFLKLYLGGGEERQMRNRILNCPSYSMVWGSGHPWQLQVNVCGL